MLRGSRSHDVGDKSTESSGPDSGPELRRQILRQEMHRSLALLLFDDFG